MKILILLLVEFFCYTRGSINRIVGGQYTNIEYFPHQVSLQFFGSHVCGGAILHAKVVVTAAHCFEMHRNYEELCRTGQILVQTGANIASAGGLLHRPFACIRHAEFQMRPHFVNDIALVFLIDPIHTTPVSKPISMINRMEVEGDVALVSGYGNTIANVEDRVRNLKFMRTPIIPFEKCRAILLNHGSLVTEGMICAGGVQNQGTCQGDSGGPLIINGELAGLPSWVSGSCAHAALPDVYTSVYRYQPWIGAVVKQVLNLS